MGNELCVISTTALSQAEQSELSTNIDALISAYTNNRQEINRLVFESVAAMTAGEDYEQELANKKGLRRFLGNITGSNQKLQVKINSSRAAAQYAAQMTLQRLAEQNLMSFDLITAVNNKLNASLVNVETEINNIYAALIKFFKQSKSDMVRLEGRVERLERNVNLLNWQNSIEYQMFDGTEYAELDDAAKIVCLARDFYDIMKGDWSTSDLLLLKTAMGTVNLPAKGKISYQVFLRELDERPELREYLFSGKNMAVLPSPEYMPLLSGMKKNEMLSSEERYLVTSTQELLKKHNVNTSEAEIAEAMTKEYLATEGNVDILKESECFDFIMELLFSLQLAEDMQYFGDANIEEAVVSAENPVPAKPAEESLDEKFMRASELFRTCELEQARPLLEELSDAGYAKANAMLAYIYKDGYPGLECENEKKWTYVERGYLAGDACSAILYAISCEEEEKVRICRQYKPVLVKEYEAGDYLASYLLGMSYIYDTDEEADPFLAASYFLEAASQGFYRAYFSLAILYQDGEGVSKDADSALLWALKATEYDFGRAHNLLGDINYDAEDYENALTDYLEAIRCGYPYSANQLGYMYMTGKGVTEDENTAAKYFLQAAKSGYSEAQCNVGVCYFRGDGVPENRAEAKRWFKLAAEQGNEKAQRILRDEF